MKLTFRFTVYAFLLLTLAGCGALLGAPTPEQAVRESETRIHPEIAASLQILGRRSWARGVVVLYSYVQPARDEMPAMQMFGHSLVERTALGTWQTHGGGAGGSSAPPPKEDWVDFGRGSGSNDQNSYSLIFGRTLSPEVKAVEASFDDGQTLRDTTLDGFFVLITPKLVQACEMRVLGADDQVLRRIDLAHQFAPGKGAGEPANNCP